MNEDVKIGIGVDIDATKSISDLAALRKEVKTLKREQQALDTTTREGAERYEEYALEIREANAEIQKISRETVKYSQKLKDAHGSLDGMRKQLSLNTAAYNRLSEAQRQGAEGQALAKSITDLSGKLKEAEGQIGMFQRSVGDYENAVKRALGSTGTFGKTVSALKGATAGGVNPVKALTTGILSLTKACIAFIATPIGAVITAIAVAVITLVKTFGAAVKAMKGNEEQSHALAMALAPLRVLADALTNSFSKLGEVVVSVMGAVSRAVAWFTDLIGVTKGLSEATQEYVSVETRRLTLSKESRAFAEKEAAAQIKLSEIRTQLTDKENTTVEERLLLLQELENGEIALATERKKIAAENLAILEEQAKRTRNSAEAEEELTRARVELSQVTVELNNTQRTINKQRSTMLAQQQAEEETANKDAKARAKEYADALYTATSASMERRKQLSAELLKAESGFYSKDITQRQAYAKRLFDLDQKLATDKLELSRKTNRVTEEEYKETVNIMLAQSRAFAAEQANAMSSHLADLKARIRDAAGATLDEQTALIEQKYRSLVDEMASIPVPVRVDGMSDADYNTLLSEYEAFVFERSANEVRLENAKVEEIKRLNEQARAAMESDILATVRESYGAQIDEATNNEEKRLGLIRDAINEEIALRKKSGLDIADLERSLGETLRAIDAVHYKKSLLQADVAGSEKYALRKEQLESERELYDEGSLEFLTVEQELTLLMQEEWERRIEGIQEWADTTLSVLNSVSDIMSGISERQLEDFTKSQDGQRKALEKRLKAGTISQEKYDRDIAALDEELEAKKEKLEKQAARRQKTLKAAEITIDTASGIAKAVAASPLTFGLPFSAFVAATGLAQLAAVLAAPVAEDGMLITGNPHSQGGEIINAEGGEAIINKRSVSMFKPLLSAINVAGGGVPFTASGADGGFFSRNATEAIGGLSAESLAEALGDVNISVAVEDINLGQSRYATVTQAGEIF